MVVPTNFTTTLIPSCSFIIHMNSSFCLMVPTLPDPILSTTESIQSPQESN